MQQDRLCEMQDVLQHLTDRKNLWAIGDGKNGFSSVPNGFFCYCYTTEIKLNILTLEYTKFRDGRCNGYDDYRNERIKRTKQQKRWEHIR